MLCKSFQLLILLFVSFNGFSQSIIWAKNMGGSSSDNGRKSITDVNGNTYIGGSVRGTNVDMDPSASNYFLNSAGQKDIFVAKYNSAGTFQWAFRIGGSSEDDVIHLTLDKAGDLLVTGYFRGSNVDFDPGPGTATLNSNGESGSDPGFGGDIFVAKFDIQGNYKWAFNIGGTLLSESGRGIAVDNNNNILLTGYSHCPADFDPSSGSYILDGTNDPLFIAKYTTAGQLIWAFNTGTGGVDNSGISIAADDQDNIVVTGFFQGSNVDFNPSTTQANFLSSSGSFEIFLAKYTSSGNFLWAHSISGNGYDEPRDLTIDTDNNIYIVGDFLSGTLDLDPSTTNNIVSNSGGNDIFLAKYSTAGLHQWGYKIGGTGNDKGWGMTRDNNNNVIILGSFSSTVDFDPSASTNSLISNGSSDAYAAKYSNTGALICAFNIGGSGFDESYSATVLGNHIYISGTFNSVNADFDPSTGSYLLSSQGDDIYIGKYDWSFVPPAGTITGGSFCTGQQQPQLTFTATTGTGPFSLVISDGVNSFTYTNIQSGVAFNLQSPPTQTTTYTLVSIKDATRCASPVSANSTATITIACGAEICNNGLDDDGDNLIDCADQDCLGCNTPCGPIPSINPKIFNTGNNGQGGLIAVGAVDRHWTVSNTLNGVQRPAIYTGNCAAGYWTPTPYPDAGWITDQQLGPCGFAIPQMATTPRYFSTKFDVPASLVSSLRLAFDVYADNYVGEVYLNGVPLGISNTTSDLYCAGCNISFSINSGFVSGTNTLTILLLQLPIPETPLGQFLGLLVNASSSLDSDNDGVVDGVDQCPGTPPGISVNSAGCFDLSIAATTPLCAGDSLVLESSNAGTSSVYQWTTPSGQILTGKRIAIQNVTTSQAGKYVLQVTDIFNCIHKDSVNVQVNSKPIINISPSSNICTGSSIQLSATGGGSYQWSPITGLSNPSIANPIASPTTPTTYQVVVTNINGCKDSAITTIGVLPPSPISVSPNTSICRKDSVQLIAAGGTSYQWSPGAGLSSTNIANPKASPNVTTTYKVIVSSATTCSDSAFVTITVNSLPTITLAPSANVCIGDSAQLSASGGSNYQWSPSSGLSNAFIANPKASPSSTTSYQVLVSNTAGCKDSASITVNVSQIPVITISQPVTICKGDTALLSATGGIAYEWWGTEQMFNTNNDTVSVFPDSTAEYVVMVSNGTCMASLTTTVTVIPKPLLNLGPDVEICENENASFDATIPGASGYVWNNGQTSPTITVTQGGSYHVSAGVTGCSTPARDTVVVAILPPPTVNLGPDTTACNFTTLILTAEGENISQYLWSTGSTDTTIVVTANGLYTITASNACGTASDDIEVILEICGDDIYFPTAFTPNYDGKNDRFKAAYMNGIQVLDYSLKVFNRWGELVFKTNDISQGWDGIIKGKEQQSDVYVWVAEYKKSSSGEVINKKGTVLLLR